ncbi:hypothetical protein [Catenulispora rubra]|uniref:hypothetical protein n=1 Tax=Catenulispora rubra TaxID=280293 RepID=UPI0018920DC9|nr:hypothetical protein [Catenulispora rubra]
MGEYTGRRRGRAASEPSAQEPEYVYPEDPAYQQGYFADDSSYADPSYAQQPEGYGYEYGYEHPVAEYQGYETQQQYGYEAAPAYEQPPQPHQGYEYAPDPAYGYQNAPSYEQYPSPSYEQYPSYEQQPSYEQYDQSQSYEQQQGAYYEDYPQEGYQEAYPQEGYEGYQEPYYEEPFEEPPVQSRRRRSAPAAESYAEPYQDDYSGEYSDDYAPARENLARPRLSLLQHLPYAGAATAAIAVTAFVSAKAVAAVVLPLQLVVAWAVLDLAGFASRRTAVLAALPAMAGAAATFKFQPDDAVLPAAAGLGAGFVLVAADAVFRARRRGVEPGAVRALAAAASALLFAGLTGLFVPAAVLHLTSVAAGAVVCAVLSVSAARNAELGASRAAVVAIPVTIAALASYAAAILVP